MKKLLVFTACLADNPDQLWRLQQSCDALGIDFKYYGLKEVFVNFRQAKIERAIEFLETIKDDYEYCLYTDGFDSWLQLTADEIVERFEDFNTKIVIAGERNCYPLTDYVDGFPEAESTSLNIPSSFRYPCAGGFMGKTTDVLAALRTILDSSSEDDQALWSWAILKSAVEIKIDSLNAIFLSAGSLYRHEIITRFRSLYVIETQDVTAVIHFNGPKGGSMIERNMNHFWEITESLLLQWKTGTLNEKELGVNK